MNLLKYRIFETTRSDVYKKISEMMPARKLSDYFLELSDEGIHVRIDLGIFYEEDDKVRKIFLTDDISKYNFRNKIEFKSDKEPRFGYHVVLNLNQPYIDDIKFFKEFLPTMEKRFSDYEAYVYTYDFKKGSLFIQLIRKD